jgi:putative transposase
MLLLNLHRGDDFVEKLEKLETTTIYKGFQYRIYPNNKQNTRMFQIANATRYAYNWALDFAMKYFEKHSKFISEYDITKEFTKHKLNNEWLYEVPNNTLKQSVKCASRTVKTVYINNKKNHTNNKPCFKCKFKYTPSIYLDSCQIKFTEIAVKLDRISLSTKSNRTKLNWIRLNRKHKIPIGLKSYQNPVVKFINNCWIISVSVPISEIQKPKIISETTLESGLGIDLGVKNLATCSDSVVLSNINKTDVMKKLEKRHKRQQRKFSRKLEMNRRNNKVVYSKNMSKQKEIMNKITRKMTNIRTNYIYQSVNEIIKRKPSFIAIEDLNISGMMHNKHLSKSIQDQKLYFFRTVLTYKCLCNNIPLAVISTWYPSSKTCSCCGNIYRELKLNERIYHCKYCNLIIDRDYNASINIRNEGFRLLQEQLYQTA